MTPERQLESIAAFCRWGKLHWEWERFYSGARPERRLYGVHPVWGKEERVADYLSCPVAMWRAVDNLSSDQLGRDRFIKELGDVILRERGIHGSSMEGAFWMVHSTLPQQREALLKAIGKWEESTKPEGGL